MPVKRGVVATMASFKEQFFKAMKRFQVLPAGQISGRCSVWPWMAGSLDSPGISERTHTPAERKRHKVLNRYFATEDYFDIINSDKKSTL